MLSCHANQCKGCHSLQQLLKQGLLEVEWIKYCKQLPDDKTAKNTPLHSYFHTNAQQNDIRYIYQIHPLWSNNKRPFSTPDRTQLCLFSSESLLTDVGKQSLLFLIFFSKCLELIWCGEQTIYRPNMYLLYRKPDWKLEKGVIQKSKDFSPRSVYFHS